MSRLALFLLLCGSAVACSSSTEPQQQISHVNVSLQQAPGDPLTTTAHAVDGGVLVEGSVGGACVGVPITATAQRTDSLVELRVLPTTRPQCDAGTETVQYQATLSLAPGGYMVVVEHGVNLELQQVLKEFVTVR
ncbi:MAG TPA: hypothetical protein VFS44_06745 [Gemmatimonadaceae bacterium]|nr:hypothetical protein [Gemmatimonadaceae bacterium]